MLDIKVDLREFEAAMKAAPEALGRGVQDGGDRAAQITLNGYQTQKRKTYARPTMGWKRSGDWLEGSKIDKPSPWQWIIHTVGRAADYDARLANLPTGAGGINRTNRAADTAAGIVANQVLAAIKNAIDNALRRFR